jgi:hypothetical protein
MPPGWPAARLEARRLGQSKASITLPTRWYRDQSPHGRLQLALRLVIVQRCLQAALHAYINEYARAIERRMLDGEP